MNRRATLLALLVAAGLALTTSLAFAGKGGNSGRYQGNLTATPNVLHVGDTFTVSGCGYNPDYGNVVVGFLGGSWGSPLDSNGCFSIASIPAMSGDSLPAGTYAVTAYQYVHGKLTETGETSVTVVS